MGKAISQSVNSKTINARKSLACSAFCHENPETQPVSLTQKRAQTSKKSTAYHVEHTDTANHRV